MTYRSRMARLATGVTRKLSWMHTQKVHTAEMTKTVAHITLYVLPTKKE
jgi:hypothetical protein